MERLSGGSVQTAAAITFNIYGCNKEDPLGQTFVQVYDKGGSPMQITASGAGVWCFPDDIYKTLWCKLVGTQTSVDLCLKS
jgi:hypothetical protein